MIAQGALAEYLPVEMMLRDHPRHLRANALMKLELDPRNPSTFKYNKLSKHVHNKCVTADDSTLRDLE